MPFALGKVAAAMFIEYAANAYGKNGYRFVYLSLGARPNLPLSNAELLYTDLPGFISRTNASRTAGRQGKTLMVLLTQTCIGNWRVKANNQNG